MARQKEKAGGTILTLDDWRRMHTVAARVRSLEPWLWMEESDIFGVQDTQSNMTLFVSVMGALGEHFAVAVYPGASELARQRQLGNIPDDLRADLFFDIRHAQVAFDKKSNLQPQEKAIVKQLGIVHKGGHAWPSFQSFRPGLFPWLVDAEEARWLLLAMEQLLVLAPRIEQNPAILLSATDDADAILVRSPDAAAPGGWREEFHAFPPPTHRVQVTVPPELVGTVQALPQSDLHIEADVFPLTMPIGQPGERPQLPYTLLLVDSASLFVLGFKMLSVQSSVEAMWLEAPAKLLEILAKCGQHPTSITVQTPWLGAMLEAPCRELGIALRSGPLHALPQVRHDMERMMLR